MTLEMKGNAAVQKGSTSLTTHLQLSKLDFALLAVSKGIPVIPVRSGAKVGYAGWPRLRSTNRDVILGWHFDTYPGCNFGLVMGSGYVCLDIDNKNGKQGTENLRVGLYDGVIDTFSVKTPHGGEHFFFSTGEKEIATRLGLLDGVDVIGAGGYVVAPYSTLGNGGTYLPRGDIDQIAAIPAWLTERLKAKTEKTAPVARVFVADEVRPLAETLPDSEQAALTRHLTRIDPNLSYDAWYRTLFAALNVWGLKRGTVDLLRQWSAESHKWDTKEFDKKISSYDPNHAEKLGTVFLKQTADEWRRRPPPEPIEADQLTEIELAGLVDRHLNGTLTIIRGFENEPSDAHQSALRVISETVLRGLYSSKATFRRAFPLETGMGKTSSVVALCKLIASERLEKSLLIACERVEQLQDLRSMMIMDGVPDGEIGILHNSRDYKQTVPPISVDAISKYRFLLVCHSRIKVESIYSANPGKLLAFKEGKRDLVIWDESIISTRGHHLSRIQLVDSLQAWLGRYFEMRADGRKSPRHANEYEQFRAFLEDARDKVLSTADGIVALNSLAQGQKSAVSCIRTLLSGGHSAPNDTDHVERLIKLVEFAERGQLRIIQAQSDLSLVQFEQTIDDAFDKMVILDGSCRIRALIDYDPSVQIHPLPITKRYSRVTVSWTDAKGSKSSFKDDHGKQHFDSYRKCFLWMLEHKFPKDTDGIVYCHLEREEEVRAVVADAQKTLLRRGDIHVLHWGQHRATNKYAHCKWTFCFGVQYLRPADIVAMIVGQTRRLDYPLLDDEIPNVQDSEMADTLYQGISRGNSRRTIKGEAGEQRVHLCLPAPQAARVLARLERAMPGVKIEEIDTGHFTRIPHQRALDYIELGSVIAELLRHLPRNISRISTLKIRQELKLSKPSSNSSTWRNGVCYALEQLVGWQQERHGFVRKNSPAPTEDVAEATTTSEPATNINDELVPDEDEFFVMG